MYAFTDAAWLLGWMAEGLVKSTLILTAAWGVTACLLRSSSASLRHWIWITALVSLLVMPVLTPLLPAWEVPWLRVPMAQLQPAAGPDVQTRVYQTSRVASQSNEAARGEAGPASSSAPAALPAERDEALPLADWLVLGWLAGAAVFVLRPAFGVAYVARLTRRARRNGGTVAEGDVVRLIQAEDLVRRVTVVRSARVAIPVTWGIWRPVILLPMESSTWDGAQLRSVLLHELAHIRRWDYPLYLLAQIARAWYWFNPLVWVAVRRVQAEQEQACDDRVLQAGMQSADYATHLLAVARAYRQPGALAGGSVGMARRSALKGRVRAILSPQTNRRPLSLPAGTYATALMGLLAVPIAMVPGPNAARTPVQQLVRTLEQGDVAARQQAALQLGRIDDPRAVEALIAALHDAAEPVSVSARLALRRFDTPRARQALQPAVPPMAVELAASTAPDEAGAAYVWLEAEHGTLDDPMQLLGTVEASGGSYVKVPQDWSYDEADQDDEHLELKKHGAVTFVFTIEQKGDYAIWGRTLAPATDKNSFFVSVDDAPDVIWDTPDELVTASRWAWDRVSARGQNGQPGDDPMIVHLEPGPHTLQVRNREKGTKLDRLLVTNDLDYQPTGHGALPAPTHYRNLWIEAEDGTLSEPLRVLDDGSAVNGQYLDVDDGHNSTEQPPERGRGLYRFTIPEAGTYMLWGRLIAPDDTGDSFWVRVDGDQWVPWNGIWQEEEWHWVPVYHTEDVTQPMQFSLSAGAHTIEIAYREDGTKLDRLLITNDLSYEPEGMGEAAKPVEVIFRTD